jgi:hypothetical protein
MAEESRWVKYAMTCPEGRGESQLFVEWRVSLWNGVLRVGRRLSVAPVATTPT